MTSIPLFNMSSGGRRNESTVNHLSAQFSYIVPTAGFVIADLFSIILIKNSKTILKDSYAIYIYNIIN